MPQTSEINKCVRINEWNESVKRSPNITSQTGLEILTSSDFQCSRKIISHASKLAFDTLSISLQRSGDKNVLPLIHVYFVFLWSLAAVEKALIHVERDIPWDEICFFLNNTLARLDSLTPSAMTRLMCEQFPKFENGIGQLLPEELSIRGKCTHGDTFQILISKTQKSTMRKASWNWPPWPCLVWRKSSGLDFA